MKIIDTEFPGLLILEPNVHRDARGFFLETFREENFSAVGVNFRCVQANQSFSADKGVLRGLHYQVPPKAQAKLVWVTRGEALDVVVDLRSGLSTFGRHYSVHLSAFNFRRLFIPKGFAHGYITLTPEVEFNYMVDEYYDPAREGGLAWNDPDLGINWALPGMEVISPILSEKDRGNPFFRNLKKIF